MTEEQHRRTSPLHRVHEEAGASFTDFGGWQMPLRYGSELAEHRAVRTAAGIFDLSHMGEVRVTGPQAAAALDHALTADVSAMPPGRARYALVCTEAGTVVDDVIVYRLAGGDMAGGDPDGGFLVVPNAGNATAVAAALVERAAGFRATVRDESAQTALIAVQGPRSEQVVRAALPGAGAAVLAGMAAYTARRGTVRTGAAGEVTVLVARTGYTGEDGFELIIGPVAERAGLTEAAEAVWTALRCAAEAAGVEMVPCGLASRDSLRLEAGMPLYGHELDLDHLPGESGVGSAVPLDSKEADFVGRRALLDARASGSGVTSGQRMVGLRGEGRRAARSGYPVLGPDGDTVGVVTSGLPSPTLGQPIALARVDVAAGQVGTVLSVDLRGRPEPFTVVDPPFYRRS